MKAVLAAPLASFIEDVVARATERWPGIELASSVFARALATGLLGETPPTPAELEGVCGTELFLTTACAAGDRRAIEHLERSYISEVPRAIMRVAADRSTRDEVIQRLRTKLLVSTPERRARIAEYRGRGALAAWLRVAALREAITVQRERRGEIIPDGMVADHALAKRSAGVAPSPEHALARARHGADLRKLFADVVAALPPEDRTILRLHYVDALEMDEIGQIFGVHRSTISRRIAKIREHVATTMRKRIRESSRASTSDIESILRLMQTDLGMSIHDVFSL